MNVRVSGVDETPQNAPVRSQGFNGPRIDYAHPAGAAALYAPDSVAWRVYKNPLTVLIGGITAVMLELAEPRVRTGVWEHSVFRTDPMSRIRRTGVATLATIYAPAESARRLIANVGRMHARVGGVTPEGTPYQASEVELLNWVQATVDYGFMEAYSAYGARLTDAERSAFYAESQVSARLFGAISKPASLEEQNGLFERMIPTLEAHPIVLEFLAIVMGVEKLPRGLRWLQHMVVRAGIDLLPEPVIERLALGREWRTRSWERFFLRRLGWLLDRIPVRGSAPVQASERLGLPGTYLYRRRRMSGTG